MSIRTAGYDVEQDKIIGCSPGSPEWWHESGHQFLEHKTGFHTWELSLRYKLLWLGVFFCAVKLNIFAIASLAILALLQLIGELFAWGYALKHKGDWIKGV